MKTITVCGSRVFFTEIEQLKTDLEKPIFILNDIPEQSNEVEIEGLKPISLHGDLRLLVEYSK